MKKLNILLTGGGSPGIAGTIFSLRNNYDKRELKIICTDAKENCAGKYLADGFYQIPRAIETDIYLEKLLEICILEKIDIILPQNTVELIILAENKNKFSRSGIEIVISDADKLSLANNKYELLRICQEIGIPYPKYFLVNNKEQLIKAAKKLGWPQKTFIIKPPSSNGSRGLRIIDDNKDYKQLFFNEKPTSLYTKFLNLLEMIGDSFEPLLAMEYLVGEEVTIDLFRDESTFISIPRIREEIRSGISFQNLAVKRDDLINYSKILADHLNLKFCFGFQFKYDFNGLPKILECNPRVQGTMVFATLMGANIIYSAIKSCLGEPLPEFSLVWDTRLLRYWGAIGINSNGIIKI